MITKDMEAEYIEHQGARCPFCGSENISAGFFNGEQMTQDVSCLDCHSEWYDKFDLIGIGE